MLKYILFGLAALFIIGLAYYVVVFILGLIVLILELAWKIVKFLFKASIVLAVIGAAIYFYQISIPAVALYITYSFIKNKRRKRKLREWLNMDIGIVNEGLIDDTIINEIDSVRTNDDSPEDYKFDCFNMPYGRASAFLGYFEKNLETDEPYYYSVSRSKVDNEIREYGSLITSRGIYISKQYYVDSEKKFAVEDTEIPYTCLKSIVTTDKGLGLCYVDPAMLSEKNMQIEGDITSINIDQLLTLLMKVIANHIPQALYQNKISSYHDLNLADSEFKKSQSIDKTNKAVEVASVIASGTDLKGQYDELKYNMNGSRGHGYGAEYGNNVADKLLGRDVVNAGQILDDTGRQVKHGADRIVNDVNIQTKYYKTASESIGAAFQKKEAIYLNDDGSMMQIEVPRDQYHEAVKIMQKRIDSGQVPNVQPGEDARNYVRKGFFTYSEAHNICKAGTIESLSVDFVNGAITCSAASGISAAIVFSLAIWNGKDLKEASRLGFHTGIRVLGKGACIYTVTMQLSRDQIANPFKLDYTGDGQLIGFGGIDNPIFTASEGLADFVKSSPIAKSPLGEAIGLQQVNGRVMISTGVTAVVVFGPDVFRALSGRISTKQLFKNSAVGASGIGGSMLGQALIPIPIVGAVIGGMAAGFIAKAVLDEFIEDDAKEMFQILKEEFLDIVILSNLNEEEFEEVTALTLCNKKLSSMLRDMYASQNYRLFAREAIVSEAVSTVISNRKFISEETILEGYITLLDEAS